MTAIQFLVLGILIGIAIGLITSLIIAGNPHKPIKQRYEKGI